MYLVGKQVLHKDLPYNPKRPSASEDHIFIIDGDSPKVHVYDWSAEPVTVFTPEKLGLHHQESIVRGSPVVDGMWSIHTHNKSTGGRYVVTYKVSD